MTIDANFYWDLSIRARDLADLEPDEEVRASLLVFAETWRELARGTVPDASEGDFLHPP